MSVSEAGQPLRIELVKVVDLERFIQAFVARGETPMVPISSERARAQARNPHASEHDVGLLVGYDGDRCIAFLGLLPGVLRVGNRTRKIHWFTGWYVDPTYRHTSIGALLLLKAFSLKYDLFMAGLSKDSEMLLRALRLPQLGPLSYCHVDIDHPIRVATLPLRLVRRLLQSGGYHSRWVGEATDRCSAWLRVLKAPLYGLLVHYADHALEGIACEQIDRVKDLSMAAREEDGDDGAEVAFCRDGEAIDWMLQYKWVPEGRPVKGDEKYRFLARLDSLDFVVIKVSRASDRVYLGGIVFSIGTRKGHTVVKLLDFWFLDGDHPRRLWGLALRYAARFKADRLELPEVIRPFFGGALSLLVHQQTRPYFCHLHDTDDEVGRLLPHIRLNLYDGDQAFA